MNWLDPEKVREYFANLREHGVKYSHANNVHAMEQFVRALAKELPDDDVGRAKQWFEFQEVARIIRDAQEGE